MIKIEFLKMKIPQEKSTGLKKIGKIRGLGESEKGLRSLKTPFPQGNTLF